MRDPAQWSYQTPVPFDQLTGNGAPEVFSYTQPTENQATVDYICEWANRYTVVQHLLGTGVFGVEAIRHPSRSDLFARRATITGVAGLGFDGTWAEFRYAKLNVLYITNPGGNIGGGGGGAFIEVAGESAAEYQTIPGRNMVWLAPGKAWDGVATAEPAQKLVSKKSHSISIKQWLFPNFTAMEAAKGKINQSDVQWVGRTIPAECLLFTSYSESFDQPISGFITYKVDQHFMERPQSWNKFMAEDGKFYFQNPNPYEQAAFSGIFP